MFALSRKAIVNDDLGGFRDWGIAAGRAAAETEANLLVGLLTRRMRRGSGHGRRRRALPRRPRQPRRRPATRLPGPAMTLLRSPRLARRCVIRRARTAKRRSTPFRSSCWSAPTWRPRRSACLPPSMRRPRAMRTRSPASLRSSWSRGCRRRLGISSPIRRALPVLEYAYLSSAQGPQMASREGWDVLGQEFRVVLDFGAGAVDWRGAYRNAGA